MKFSEAKIENGQLVETNIREISQSQLSCECWSVQIRGLNYCKTCEFLGKRDCGGKQIRKTGKNELGFQVPIGGKMCTCPNCIVAAIPLEEPKKRVYGARGYSRCWSFVLASGRTIDRYAVVSRCKRDLRKSPVGLHYNNTSTILYPVCANSEG